MEYFIDKVSEPYSTVINDKKVKVIDCRCNVCGNISVFRFYNLKRKNRSVCNGCKGKALPNFVNSKNNKLYPTWSLILRRVDNTNIKKQGNDRYYDGITICEEWKDFKEFEKWSLSNGWEQGLSIDRIDNNKGYNPENCRIANQSTQMANRKKLKTNSTGYIGVCASGRVNQPYKVSINFEGVTLLNKRFKTLKEAVEARNKCIDCNNLPHNKEQYKD